MSILTEYFEKLAAAGSAAVAQEFPAHPSVVTDAPQRSAAACWQAVAVHPMQVLETGYQDVVRAAGAKAADDDGRREAESEAMSRFFALGSTSLLRLEVPSGPLSVLLSDRPLVEDLLEQMASAAASARAKLDQPTSGRATVGDLALVLTPASRAVVAMAPAGVRAPLPAGVAKAATYLGMLDTSTTAADAVTNWIKVHQNAVLEPNLKDLLAEIDTQVVQPLRSSDNAVAAVRALYNIEDFTLVRLMHRFDGGTGQEPMPLDQRRVASGRVTGGMHPPTVTSWHEQQVAALGAAITQVDDALRGELRRKEPVTRFYLKGGRAVFTALGTPDQGTNDWDTGVLIDPDLPPDDWYTAFAGVHDVVVRTLDGLRYGYTQELCCRPPAARAVAATAVVEQDQGNEAFTLAAEAAEEQVHRAQEVRGMRATGGDAMLGAVVQRLGRPAGVNGELIDVGIPTRSSVELLELWRTLRVTAKPGVSGTKLPVPTLPYYVADLSTILREAAADEDGTPDRKLGKRLVRLAIVLGAADLAAETAARLKRLTAALPRTLAKLRPDPATVTGRLQVLTLADLVDSLAEPPAPDADLDAYLAQQLEHHLLYDERCTQVTKLWSAVEAGIPEAQRAEARTLLSILVGTHRVADVLLADRPLRQRGLGIDLAQQNPTGAWKVLVGALDKLAGLSKDSARFVVTGPLALHLQLRRAGVAELPDVAPVDRVTVDMWLAERDPQRIGIALSSVQTALSGAGAAKVEGEGAQARLVLRQDLTTSPKIGTATGAVALVVRPVTPGDASGLDVVRGWSVTPSRLLVQDYLEQAAATPDFDLREAVHAGSSAVLRRVLGHAVGPVRSGAVF